MLTPDQITRVKEAIADLQMEAADNRNSGFTDEADRFDAHAAALSALLQERETLRAALAALVAKLDEVTPHVANAFVLSAAHGMHYDGPNYADELSAARALLTPREDR